MNITLNIEAGSPAELQEAITGLAGIVGGTVTPQAELEKPKRNARTKPDPEKQPDPEEDIGLKVELEPEDEDEEETETFTVVEVRAKASAVSKAGKAAGVKALLTKFGVDKLTDIPAEKYAEFMAALDKL